MAANAALLDELMGRNRNLAPEEMKAAEVHFDHVTVCKYYLCGFCPHELFRNTRVDIGGCDKIHEDDLVTEYKNSKKYQRMGYEDDFNRFVQSLITDIDKKIRRGEQRLGLTAGGGASSRDERLQWLSQRISELHREAEQAGCDGRVDESQRMMRQADQLNEERQQLERQAVSGPIGSGGKEMEVCPICGSFQVKNEAPAKVEEHIKGRQHIGYATLRGYIKGLEEDKKKKAEAERLEVENRRKKREEDDRKRDEDVDRRRRRSRSRDGRNRSRDRSRRSRSRDRRRSRERRSRSRDRSRRSRSRDRRRSRERRERRRSRSRDRPRRSRSRDRRRSRRSRSKDRRRSRSRDRSRRERSRSKERSGRSSKSKDVRESKERKVKDASPEKKTAEAEKKETGPAEVKGAGDAEDQELNGQESKKIEAVAAEDAATKMEVNGEED